MARIQLRRGTAAQWTSADPVLLEGELGLETDTGRIKVGDGVANWNTTTYNVSSGSTVADITVGPDNPASGGGALSYDGATATLTFTPAFETTTSLSIAANVLTYTDEDGVETDIDLNLYLDDTNLARLTSGSMNPNTRIATFTRDDGTTFDVDFSSVLHDIYRVSVGADDSTLHEINSGESIKFIGGENVTTASDTEGNITINAPFTGTFRGDLVGSVFADDSTTLIDGISGTIFKANIEDSGNWDTAFSWGDHSIVGYLTVETNDLSSAVTWVNVPDANITESSVTQHQAALSITESQISDLQAYITADSVDTLTNKSGNISQWTNDSAYLTDITAESLGDLTDVNLTSPADGELLMYNGISWSNVSDLTARLDFLEGARFRGETSHYWEELSIQGTPGHVQTFNFNNADRTGYFYITDMEHDMIININNHAAVQTNRQVFSVVVAVDNNNSFGGVICNDIQIDGFPYTVDWGAGNLVPTGTQGQIDVVEFVVFSTAGVGYNIIGRHWQKSGNDVFLVDGGTATSIYTNGDLELDGGGA